MIEPMMIVDSDARGCGHKLAASDLWSQREPITVFDMAMAVGKPAS